MKKSNVKKEKLIKKIMRGVIKITRHKLFRNKLYAVILMFIGWLTIGIDNDCTAFILLSLVSLMLFFSKENVIN